MAERARRAAVLGRPVSHSRSPALHRAAYAALGLDWSYEAIECDAEMLPGVLAERPDWAGFSCTMPLKRVLLDVAAEVRPLARDVGAGNTLLPRPGGGWIADNTDVHGILAALREVEVEASDVCMLGAGGTAQAAIAALAQLGLASCRVLVRDPARAGVLREVAGRFAVTVDVQSLRADAPELDADLVISTLPAGAADPLAAHAWRAGQALLDVVYDRWPTPLARAVDAAGGTVVGGALMLLHQAAAQVELMTGCAAPIEAMRAALPTGT